MAKVSPPLKWAGGKRWLVPILRSQWESHADCRLVEPFTGGLAVALGLRPKAALLNDINVHLINFYKQLQAGLKSDLSPDDNDKDIFYARREQFNSLIQQNNHQTQESAKLFYYLNRTCFNGLCRFNSKGYFNVPFGRHKRINYKTTSEFKWYQNILAQWHFSHGDFEKLRLRDNDFVYADPPYDVQFTKYAKDDFRWEDQIRLAEWLTQHPGPVVLSNQATERILELYRDYDFEVTLLNAPRRISRTGDRTPAKEVVAIRNMKMIEYAPRLL